MTGLENAQLDALVARVHAHHGGFTSHGRGYCLGLYRSVALVVFLLRETPPRPSPRRCSGSVNPRCRDASTRCGRRSRSCSPTCSRTQPRRHAGARCPWTEPWPAPGTGRDDLYSGKHRDTGFTCRSPPPSTDDSWPSVHRHDAHAWTASGLTDTLDSMHIAADLGYLDTGVLTGTRTPVGGELSADRTETNKALSAIRAVVEHALSHLRNRKIPGGPLPRPTRQIRQHHPHRHRPPLLQIQRMLVNRPPSLRATQDELNPAHRESRLIAGMAYRCGTSEFALDPRDPFVAGFVLR
jgi:DDE superfamily endonuclease